MTDTTPVDAPDEEEHSMTNEEATEVVENDEALQEAGADSDDDAS